jgi:hypothetical protein
MTRARHLDKQSEMISEIINRKTLRGNREMMPVGECVTIVLEILAREFKLWPYELVEFLSNYTSNYVEEEEEVTFEEVMGVDNSD